VYVCVCLSLYVHVIVNTHMDYRTGMKQSETS
jgi:hypothetical protein